MAPDATDNSGLVRAAANDNDNNADAPARHHQAIVPDKAEPYSVSIKVQNTKFLFIWLS